MTCLRGAWPWWRWALTGLSCLALALSAYLGWRYMAGGSVIGCGPGAAGCDRVLTSQWSSIAGVLPVSNLAAGAYLAMLVASLSVGPTTKLAVRRLAWRAMLVLVGAATGSAVWFILVQKWILGAFCPYCMATHLIGLLLAILVIWQAPRQLDGDNSTDLTAASPNTSSVLLKAVSPAISRRVIGFAAALGLTLVGLGLAGMLAACQVGFVPPAVSRGRNSQLELPSIDAHAVPLLGSSEAPYIVHVLFDYKCSHCQHLHFLLNEAVRRYRTKLAFALWPTPLNRQCNPYVAQDVDEFKDSCEVAKIALAVWVAKRQAFADFDQWMFSFESGDGWRPRTLDAAKAKAVELVGQANFNSALTNSWIERHMQASIRAYGQTITTGNSAIPKLVFGSHWVIPEPNDAEDLVLILQRGLAVPVP